MRRAAKVDGNQSEIRKAFESLGCSVLSLAAIGKGVPDLLCSLGAVSVLVEVKTAKGKLRPAQDEFRARWGGWTEVARDMGDVELIASQMRARALGAGL